MPILEKTNKTPEAKESDVSSVFEKVMNSRPNASSTERVLDEMREQLKLLAVRMNLSVEELLKDAEMTGESTDEHRQAASLARRIAFLSK